MCVCGFFFFLLQNNARAQHTAINVASADNLGYEMLSRPDYSPDLAASDLYLFSELKRKLKETQFRDEAGDFGAAEAWFDEKSSGFYSQGITK